MKNMQMWAVDRLLDGGGEFREVAPDEVIFRTGDAGNYMALIVRSAVEIRRGGRTIATVESGSVFGEMALIDRKPRSADAVARTAGRIATVTLSHFRKLVHEDPDFALSLMKILTHRLRANHES